jgi:hypothetical protein
MNHSKDCKPICKVSVADLVKWVGGIDRAGWPDWHKGSYRPAVVADPRWEDMGERTKPVIDKVLKEFPGCRAINPNITTVHPGDYVPPHTDSTCQGWVTRVHVPIVTNAGAVMLVAGKEYHLEAGHAYLFDISKPHAIRNDGKASRIHLMFDVVKND